MPKTRPILTKRNQLLFPLYHEKEYCPYILVIDDIEKPLTSTLVAETMARGKAIQPAIVHLQSETYLMLLRTNQGTICYDASKSCFFTKIFHAAALFS